MPDQKPGSREVERAAEMAAVAATEAAWPQTRAMLRVILVVLIVAAGLWMLYALQGVILLVVLSMFFAYLIAPLVELVRRPITVRGRKHVMPPALAIGIVYLLLFGSIGVGTYLLSPQLSTQITQFGQQAPAYATHMRDRLQSWRYLINPDRFPQAIREALDKTFARSMETVGEYLSYGLSGLFELLSYLPWVILIPILAFFLLKDAEAFRRSALRALPRGRLRGRGAELFEDINNTLAAYIRAALTGCLLVGVICTIGFMVIGVPYALLLGVLAGLLEFIPLVGPLVVAMGAALVASFHSIGQAVVVLLFLGILRVLQDYVIYPRLIEHGVHMHPLAVILAILCGAELAGVAGIFLAIPAAAIMSVTYRHWLEYRGSPGLVADLLKPAPTTPSAPSDQPASAAQPSSTGAPRPEVASRRSAPTR
jgi:predicted PurR-regulated permease PerM